jgi:hypothetical protein
MSDSKPNQRHWPWPDSLDALVAAPDHHSLLFENESVRVLDTRISPGDITPLHTHKWSSVFYVQSWSDFVRRDDEGNVALDSRQADSLATPPKVFWSDPTTPHTLENVGTQDLWVIAVELKEEMSSTIETDLGRLSVPK